MIYLDNAATSYPKPPQVIEAMLRCLNEQGANPGRGAYKMVLAANRVVFDSRERLARFFNLEKSADIIFTLNATEAINLALKGFLKPGDHVITTSVEHNSVTRPLKALEKKGVLTTKVSCSSQGTLNPDEVQKAIKKDTKLIVITHASNVTGTLLPLKEVGEIAKKRGITFMVDAAQTAGLFPLDVKELNIDLLAFPGHKGLMGPPGTGGLYIDPNLELEELKQGGTGGDSRNALQPSLRPERYESGTLNTVGIAGLGAALKFIEELGLNNIYVKERRLILRLLEGLSQMDKVRIYGPNIEQERAPIVSFNIEGKDCHEVAFILDQTFDIAARAGLHCAPDAHRTIGTLDTGTVRFSLSYFNTEQEIEQALEAIERICQK